MKKFCKMFSESSPRTAAAVQPNCLWNSWKTLYTTFFKPDDPDCVWFFPCAVPVCLRHFSGTICRQGRETALGLGRQMCEMYPSERSDLYLLSGLNLWVRVWLRAAQTETGNTRGGATKKHQISRILFSMNLHFSVHQPI